MKISMKELSFLSSGFELGDRMKATGIEQFGSQSCAKKHCIYFEKGGRKSMHTNLASLNLPFFSSALEIYLGQGFGLDLTLPWETEIVKSSVLRKNPRDKTDVFSFYYNLMSKIVILTEAWLLDTDMQTCPIRQIKKKYINCELIDSYLTLFGGC